jgi:hypothetical protein
MTDRRKNRFGDKTCRISRRYGLTGGTCRSRDGMDWQGSFGRYGERSARVMPALSGGMWTIFATKRGSKQTSPAPSTDSRTLSAEERWAEKMKPSRQRNLTQPQRDRLARLLWEIRREKRKGEAGFVGWYLDYLRD